MRPHEFSERVRELAATHRPFAMATVVRTDGSALAKPGFKLLIAHDGRIAGGSFGGGCPEGPIVSVAEEAMRTGESRVVRIHLVDAKRALSGMTDAGPDEIWVETDCGGTLEVHVEPMLPADRLVLVGQGGRDEVEAALVRLGRALDFEVVVVDPLPDPDLAPDRTVRASVPDPESLALGERDSVVVLTKGERDVAILSALRSVPLRYVGLLASRHRASRDREALRAAGVPEPFLSALRSPVGLDLGATTPNEIALSILAEVVAARHGRATPPRTDGHAPTEAARAPVEGARSD